MKTQPLPSVFHYVGETPEFFLASVRRMETKKKRSVNKKNLCAVKKKSGFPYPPFTHVTINWISFRT